jgi:phage FluMu gp28-like protein
MKATSRSPKRAPRGHHLCRGAGRYDHRRLVQIGRGRNVFYIGDTKDKGREFIGYVAHFAKVVAKELAEVEEFLFEDEREDGTSKFIFCLPRDLCQRLPGRGAVAAGEHSRLAGRRRDRRSRIPRNVREVIDAVNALLIWGGKIRVISPITGCSIRSTI